MARSVLLQKKTLAHMLVGSKSTPADYPVNGLGVASDLCTPHPEYLGLGTDSVERRNRYRALFAQQVEGRLLTKVRANTNKGLAVGTHRFKKEIEKLNGRRVKARKRGRPLG
ncbi:hypothetical protein [Desulfogranum mediterraneum]|uniref:hypothetical protein n=1 Tax=Desulfogranum mediterraneum TaxID=160661 RepID=UPI001ABFA015|nr:hypothetical protein [Desulfogranum mediterraneum]